MLPHTLVGSLDLAREDLASQHLICWPEGALRHVSDRLSTMENSHTCFRCSVATCMEGVAQEQEDITWPDYGQGHILPLQPLASRCRQFHVCGEHGFLRQVRLPRNHRAWGRCFCGRRDTKHLRSMQHMAELHQGLPVDVEMGCSASIPGKKHGNLLREVQVICAKMLAQAWHQVLQAQLRARKA